MSRTTLGFTYEDKEYTLAFTVGSVKRLEKSGFSFGNLADHILTATEDLFVAAFNAYHENVPNNVRKEIYKSLTNEGEDGVTEISEVLIEMISEVIEEMKPKGNISWRVTRG